MLSAPESHGWSRFGSSLLCATKNPKTFEVTEETSPVLRTTWLHTSADQWFEVERQVRWQELEDQEAPLPFAADLMVTEFHRRMRIRKRSGWTILNPTTSSHTILNLGSVTSVCKQRHRVLRAPYFFCPFFWFFRIFFWF